MGLHHDHAHPHPEQTGSEPTVHDRYGPEAAFAVAAEARLPTTKWQEEIARGLEYGLPGADSIKDRTIPTFSRGELPHFAGINTFLKAPYVEDVVFLSARVVVLACDPGRVAADLQVPLPPERPLTVKRLPESLAMRAEVEDQVRAFHHAVP
jgi:hypothetical protein